MLTEQSVRAAYQLLLGRLPESDIVVRRFIEHASFDELRDAILGSAEFAGRVANAPGLLELHPWAIAGCPQTRLGCRQLEHLASLDLPLWGRTVLCAGGESGLFPSFFADRLCKVTVPTADADAIGLLSERLRRIRRHERADAVDVCHLDLGAIQESDRTWQVVSCRDLMASPKDIGRILTNLSRLCSELLILDLRVGYGANGSIATAHATIAGNTMDIGVPTRSWVWTRLAREFPHVYMPRTQPPHADYALDWGGTVGEANSHQGMSRVTFVASRSVLSEVRLSPVLLGTQSTYLDTRPTHPDIKMNGAS